MLEAKKKNPKNLRAVIVGAITSGALPLYFIVLKYYSSNVLDLPFQWLLVSLIPVIIGLIVGGYITELKAGDYHVRFPENQILEESQPITQEAEPPADNTRRSFKKAIKIKPLLGWLKNRDKEYARTGHYMLSQVYRPSDEAGQSYDISIFVVRHETGSLTPPRKNLDAIKSAEFFFGKSWGNKIFSIKGEKGFFGVRTHAWGTFLATCRITFHDEQTKPVILYRYIDFSMATTSD